MDIFCRKYTIFVSHHSELGVEDIRQILQCVIGVLKGDLRCAKRVRHWSLPHIYLLHVVMIAGISIVVYLHV